MDLFNKKALRTAQGLNASYENTLKRLREEKDEIVSSYKEKILNFEEEICRLSYIVKEQRDLISLQKTKIDEKSAELDALKIEHQKLLDLSTKSEKENSVTIILNDDFTKITPLFRWKSDCPEKLFQAGYIQDKDIDNPIAIQLSMATVAFEGLETLLDNFSPVPLSE